jgi:phosphatidylinositol glycan class U
MWHKLAVLIFCCSLNVPDLRPNVGLFWYFFTEMFENFRLLFTCAFQINATLLYLVPLTFRLHGEPMLLAASLTALTAIFKSYPSLGDVGFYLALLPMWKHLFNCELTFI